MSHMIIKCEFLAGTGVIQAISEAKRKSSALDVACITFELNGAMFSIGKDADIYEAVMQYEAGVRFICQA